MLLFYWIVFISQLFIYSYSFTYEDVIIDDVIKIPDTKNNNFINEFKILDPTYDHNNIVIYKFLDSQKSSYIVFIKDSEDNHYVVKQEKGKELNQQFRAICETLCAYIASVLNIPSHQVKLLPIGMAFPGKFITKRIATLHTVVPGNTIRTSNNSKYGKLDIKQCIDNAIPFEKQGLNERVISCMTLHHHLPKIVALDTFIGNKDRNKANMLYDQNTDSFYAIDMALMYDITGSKKSVAQIACEQINDMIERHKKFTKEELQALTTYRSVLQALVKEFPPKKVDELLDSFVVESGLVGALSTFEEKDVSYLSNAYKRAMRQSYVYVKKLIYLLFILINN